MTRAKVVITTCGTEEEAQKIARELLERRLAACVNIISPIQSIYRWQGKVESATEWLLLIKTTAEQFAALRDAIRELHSYDLPECIMVSVEAGSPGY
ncbi:MAG TPA: divalent-cation tolerance protein CutA, partial [Terriglobales bacterium]|nr:divalent-cation tolerance protein CutA [Terriglobales bacterium]